MNALHRLVENDINIREATHKIQQLAVHGNYKFTANVAKG
jgi:hypothetical protein